MSDRYFPNQDHQHLPTLSPEEAYSELISSLDKLLTEYSPTNSFRGRKFSGFYVGPSSISFLFFALSRLFPDVHIHSKSLTLLV